MFTKILIANRGEIACRVIKTARRRGTDAHRLVGQPHMARAGIGLGIHGDGADAHAPRGLDDAAGDFTAIGNQDFCEHGLLIFI